MKKKEYLSPSCEVIELKVLDIIMQSFNIGEDDPDDEANWLPYL